MNAGFSDLISIVKKLRGKDGCPWDKEQSIEDWARYLLDEAREVVEAVENKDYDNLKEELGDVLFLVVMMSRVAEDEGKFTIDNVISDVIQKIIRRHPHVFGNVKARDAKEALRLFYEAKEKEKNKLQ